MKLFNIIILLIIPIIFYIYYIYYINKEIYDELDDEIEKLEDYLGNNISKHNKNSKVNDISKVNNISKHNKNINKYLSYLDGYWVSNKEFNKVSDIDNMILYIDFKNKTGSLIIISNNIILTKDDIDLNINEDNIKFNNNILENLEFKCSFNKKNLKSNKDFIWKNLNFNCILSIHDGNLKLFNNNTIYGDLFKDNMITSYINNI